MSLRARSVNLSTHTWASLLGSLPVLSVHSYASNWQLPFLNQQKGENSRTNYFMANLKERMVSDVRIEPATVRIPGGRASVELPLQLVKVKTMTFSETIVVYDIKVGRCSQLKWVHEALWVSKVKVIHWHWSNSIGFNIFQLLFLKLTTDFNISSRLRWAIQDQWSSGYLFIFLFILTFWTIIFLFHFPVHHHISLR